MRSFTVCLIALLLATVFVLSGCDKVTITSGDSVSATELEKFFKAHKVESHYAVALKKRSMGVVSYLATIHGYPNNLSVCEDLIVPYNKNSSKSMITGDYFCEELR